VGALHDPDMSQQSTSSLKTRLEAATRTYQDLQDDLEKAVASRAKLEAQLLETENVRKVYPFSTLFWSCIPFELLD
jgi:hypothetical protein